MDHFANLDLIVLFFFLGLSGGFAKIPPRLPESVTQFLSIYLLLTIGFKGGLTVAKADSLAGMGTAIFIGVLSCLIIPFVIFHLAKKSFQLANAAALAASYGSVSAVTFIVSTSILESQGIAFGGFMVAVMAIMEMPGIALAILLYQMAKNPEKMSWASIGKAAFMHKSILLLAGGFLIGAVIDEKNQVAIKPFFVDTFKGILAFYLLDLGAAAANEFRAVWNQKLRSFVFACVLPICFGTLSLLAACGLGVEQGNAVLLACLVGSASYIAAPAAIRISIPEASAALYTSLPLAMTFPMNVLLGIPLYVALSKYLWQ